MEVCMMKPEVKKKPKHITRNDQESQDKRAPLVPPRPTDAELAYTQYHMKRAATSNDKDESHDSELSTISENLSANKQEKGGGFFSGLLKKTPRTPGESTESQDKEAQKELSASCDILLERNTPKVKKGGLVGKLRRSASSDDLFDEDSNPDEDKKLSGSWENLLEAATSKEKTGRLLGIFKKSPKPAPRSITTTHPLSGTKELSDSWDSLADTAEEDPLAPGDLSASNNNLFEATNPTKENKVRFAGIFRRTPKTLGQQEIEDTELPVGDELKCKSTVKKRRRVVSFRIKRTLPQVPEITLSSQTSEKMPLTEETELQELNPAQESTVELEPLEMAAYPTENIPLESEEEDDELIEWWNTVKGWAEWNKTSNFQVEDEEVAMEQVANRVYMAARLFVRLFNQRGASLQQRILELLALADGADEFHKKTVTAAVGGGGASVGAGGVGLILAPFTFGASIIVTAVGISVATAGSITSATANITDTVHSRMDRKKVERMIQDYQDEIKIIRECLEFLQEGMDTLQEWDFEKYSQSTAKKALNHSVKHVLKEGGRAGKELMISTDKLISTVHILGAAGGAAKAAKAISITTGVMSALFLALDVFFLAKDSHELRKGAKTKFAAKIREVCKDLQDGLLELNKVKTQLQKTMDGIEVEEFEEIEEVQVEEELEWNPKKLLELEQELDLLEEKLDKKVEEEQKKSKEVENQKSKEKNKKSKNEKGDPEKKDKDENEEKREDNAKKEKNKESKKKKGESKLESKLEKLSDEEQEQKSGKAKEEAFKKQTQKGSKKDTKTGNQITAVKEKCESKRDKAEKDIGTNSKTDEEEKGADVKEQEEVKNGSSDPKQEDRSGNVNSVMTERESQRSKSSKEDEKWTKSKWKAVNKEKEVESSSMKNFSNRGDKSDKDRERRAKHELRESERGSSSSRDVERLTRKESDRTESWRMREEERAMKDWRVEMAKRREEKRDSEEGRPCKRDSERGMRKYCEKSDMRKGSHQSHVSRSEHSERESESRREESDSKTSHYKRVTVPDGDCRERCNGGQGSRTENLRRQFERGFGEEVEKRKKRDQESRRRGGDREHQHSQRSRPQSSTLLSDGLYI
uniref:LOW QUALITY PROTEIN: uncharacterized protein LOC109955423 n=1 Tax=Monopterus albus TaxID=43700 RepID=UPI0009B4AAC2|nr:LOW QUALITY PROTEIN: uncharacterized protein LOC109955423 [Monopterus albus]